MPLENLRVGLGSVYGRIKRPLEDLVEKVKRQEFKVPKIEPGKIAQRQLLKGTPEARKLGEDIVKVGVPRKESFLKAALRASAAPLTTLAGGTLYGFGSAAARFAKPKETVEAFKKAPLKGEGVDVFGTFEKPTKIGIATDILGAGLDVTDVARFGMMGLIVGGTRQQAKQVARVSKIKSGVDALNDIQEGFDAARKAKLGKGTVREVIRGFNTQFVDRLTPIFRLEENAIKELPAAKSAYKKMRLLAGVGGEFKSVVEQDFIEPILRPVAERGMLDDLSKLLILERNEEVIRRGLKSRYTSDVIEKAKQALKQQYGADFKILQESAEQVRKYGDSLLDRLKNSGIIDDKTYKKIKENNQFYVPFQVVDHISNLADKGKFSRTSFNVASQDVVKKLRGSESQVGDPLEALIERTGKVIALTRKNEALQTLVDLPKQDNVFKDLIVPVRTARDVKQKIKLFGKAKELKPIRNKALRLLKTRRKWLRQIESELNKLNRIGIDRYTKRPVTRNGQVSIGGIIEFRRRLKKLPRETKSIIDSLITEQPEGLKIIKNKIAHRNKKLVETIEKVEELQEAYNDIRTGITELTREARSIKTSKTGKVEAIQLLRDGINEEYLVPEEIASAIKNLDAQSHNILTKILIPQAALLRLGATGLNIGFISVNIIRDVQDALFSTFTVFKRGGPKAMFEFLGSYPAAIATALISSYILGL